MRSGKRCANCQLALQLNMLDSGGKPSIWHRTSALAKGSHFKVEYKTPNTPSITGDHGNDALTQSPTPLFPVPLTSPRTKIGKRTAPGPTRAENLYSHRPETDKKHRKLRRVTGKGLKSRKKGTHFQPKSVQEGPLHAQNCPLALVTPSSSINSSLFPPMPLSCYCRENRQLRWETISQLSRRHACNFTR